VTTGTVPPDAIRMFGVVSQQHDSSTMVNDIRRGQLPEKEVKATEILSADQAASAFFDGLTSTVEETGLRQVVWKSWCVAMQHLEDTMTGDVQDAIGEKAALELMLLTPEERYVLFAQGASVKVFGISALITRARDFQKLMAMLQTVQQSPILLQEFMRRFSPKKVLDRIFKTLNINPSDLEMTAEEQKEMPARLRSLPLFMTLAGMKTAGTEAGAPAGSQAPMNALSTQPESVVSAHGEIDQMSNPLTGIGGGAG